MTRKKDKKKKKGSVVSGSSIDYGTYMGSEEFWDKLYKSFPEVIGKHVECFYHPPKDCFYKREEWKENKMSKAPLEHETAIMVVQNGTPKATFCIRKREGTEQYEVHMWRVKLDYEVFDPGVEMNRVK